MEIHFFFWLCSPLEENLDFSHQVLSRETNVSVHTEKPSAFTSDTVIVMPT